MSDLTPVSEAATRAAVRRGTPCIVHRPGHHLHGRATTVHAVDREHDLVSAAVDGCEVAVVFSLDALRLDPQDATGRAHLAWAVAAWWQTARGSGSASHHPLTGCVWWPAGARSWGLQWPGTSVAFVPWDADAPTYVQVPELAGLDPADPTTLPDGSRRIDAEALVLVANHVLVATP